MVTGHHARRDGHGRLRRSVDLDKDQSYVLAVLTPDQLRHSIFPLGESTKTAVRAEAAARGLAVNSALSYTVSCQRHCGATQ